MRCIGNRPERFARIVVANGNLPVLPEGVEPMQLPESLELQDLEWPYDPEAVAAVGGNGMALFEKWVHYALVGRDFMPSVVMGHGVERHLSQAELDAYDAPFPARIYMAGVRKFPSLINTVSEAPTNEAARAALDAFDRPVLGMFGVHDVLLGDEATPVSLRWLGAAPLLWRNATRVQIAGAAGQPHKDYEAGHFVQEDVGPELAADIVDWMRTTR